MISRSQIMSKKEHILLRRLLSHDESALHELYAEYKTHLLLYIQRSLGKEDAEEVLQDTFMAFIESLRNFRGQSSLKTFLYAIAKRKVVDALRRKKVKKLLFSYLPEYVVDSLAVVFLHDSLDKEYVRRKIERVFDQLPHDYARILRLKYIEGYKVHAIAQVMDLPFKAAESMLFRARKAFVKVYTKHDRSDIFPFEEKI